MNTDTSQFKNTADFVKAYTDEIRGLLDEAFRFESTSPRARENINASLDLLDDIDQVTGVKAPGAA